MIAALLLTVLLLGGASPPGCTFVNARAGRFHDWTSLWASQQPGDTLTVAGTCSNAGPGGVHTAGLTLNSSAGVSYTGGNSQGVFDVFDAGFTISGGTIVGPIKVRDNASNFTLKNATIDGSGGACAILGTSCLETGNGNQGTVTLVNVTVLGGGDGANFGQDHSIYIGASALAEDDVANVQANILTVLNTIDNGWPFKSRPGCVNTLCVITYFTFGCTIAKCEQNGVVDMPCGGNYTYSHGVLERGPGGDNWHVGRSGEETAQAGHCGATYNGTIVYDTNWIIWDGPCPGAAVPGQAIVHCSGGSNCTMPGYTPTVVVKNSKIVDDPTGCHLVLGPGVQDGGGNTHYPSRAAAGLQPWPALPAHM